MMSANTTDTTIALRVARADDLAAIERLLEATGLPTVGVAEILAERAGDFIVADDAARPGELIAVAGLEVCGEEVLLRSVAVRPEVRRRGVGHELVRRLVSKAEARGFRAVHLLTTTAEHYFPRFGFERIVRSEVPEAIARSIELASACPSSAVAMRCAIG